MLHLGGYGLKGLYELAEYYARELGAYYEALTVGPSHNYCMGRADADITSWIRYFIDGMVYSFEKVREHASAESARGGVERMALLHELDARQRKALALFQRSGEITSKDVAKLFGYQPRSATWLCQRWVEAGFLEITDESRRARKYRLARRFAAT